MSVWGIVKKRGSIMESVVIMSRRGKGWKLCKDDYKPYGIFEKFLERLFQRMQFLSFSDENCRR